MLAVTTKGTREKQLAEDSIEELAQLASAAGADVVGKLLQQLPVPSKTHYAGKGKLEELLALKNNVDYLRTCASFKLTTFQEEIRILDWETVIYAWAYGVEAVLKTGEQDIIKNAGASFVFKRQNGLWQVVYYHESSVPPVRISVE